jgi:hypothetical protein
MIPADHRALVGQSFRPLTIKIRWSWGLDTVFSRLPARSTRTTGSINRMLSVISPG